MSNSPSLCWGEDRVVRDPKQNRDWPEVRTCQASHEPEKFGAEVRDVGVTDMHEALQSITASIRKLHGKFETVATLEMFRQEIDIIKDRLTQLEQGAPSVVPIQALTPEPYDVIKPLLATVRMVDGEYVASFVDANVGSSGETLEEAMLNLKDAIAAAFDLLTRTPDAELGPGPLQQKRTLEEFVRRKQ